MTAKDRRNISRRTKGDKPTDPNRRKDERRKGERREDQRVAIELWMEEIVGDDVYFRRTGNLSTGGVFLDNAIPHELGTVMTLKFTLPGSKEMVVARASVVSQAAQAKELGMGVQFISIEGDGKTRIKAYIKSL